MDKLKLAVKETGITQIAIGGEFQQIWNSKHLERRKKIWLENLIPKFEYTR
jgi:hypothetical protein